MKSDKRSNYFQDQRIEIERKNTGISKSASKDKSTNNEMENKSSSQFFNSCFVNHSLRQFACIHDHCAEQNSCFKNELLNENLIFSILRFHPDDRLNWCQEIFPDILSFTDSLSRLDLIDYVFSFNHRYIRKDGSVSQFLHEGSIIYSKENGLPVLNLKVFYELGDMKTDDNIVLSIFRYQEEKGYQKVFTKTYFAIHNSLLSEREIEVVKLCYEGLSSKMIADKLKLSIHTVKNHKRKCMNKTATHNITELIHFCLKSHCF